MLVPGEFHRSLQSPEPVLVLLIKLSSKCFRPSEAALTFFVFYDFA